MGDEILRNEDKFVFGLFPVTRGDEDGDGERSCLGDPGRIITESGGRRSDVDCVLGRESK